jgi:hypothetical protein
VTIAEERKHRDPILPDDDAQPIRRLTLRILIRRRIKFRLWGKLRDLVEEPALGPREVSRFTNAESVPVLQAGAQVARELDDAARMAADQLDGADADLLQSRTARERAKAKEDQPVGTIHGQVVTAKDAQKQADDLADRIRTEEADDIRRHRRIPGAVKASAETLFVLDIGAWVKLMMSVFNIDLRTPSTDWLFPFALSVILPAFTYATTRIYATLLRDRRLSDRSLLARGRTAVMIAAPVILSVSTVLTWLAMFWRLHDDLVEADRGEPIATIVALAVAFAIGAAPWMVLLARAFDGTPELDELNHLREALLDYHDAQEKEREKAAAFAVSAEIAKTRALRRARLEKLLDRPQLLHQRGAHIYADVRQSSDDGPSGLFQPSITVVSAALNMMIKELNAPDADAAT